MNNLNQKTKIWIANNLNVLFVGKHGVGKTAIIKKAFSENGLKYKIFSAATMDPWVDFVGVPKEKINTFQSQDFNFIKDLIGIDEQIAIEYIGNKWGLQETNIKKIISHIKDKNESTFLEFIRPKDIASHQINAFFFDEFNRSHQKIRNAVMELMQFKSINGDRFPNLRIIWGAINPEDEEKTYDVDTIDPAQKDRFHVIAEIPYEPNREYFTEKYGEIWASAAIEWWKRLDAKIQADVSPRRLDYALEFYKAEGDARDILPFSSNVSALISRLPIGSIEEKLKDLFDKNDIEEAKKFLSKENNYNIAWPQVLSNDNYKLFFLPLISDERLISWASKKTEKFTTPGKSLHELPYENLQYILENSIKIFKFMNICKLIVDSDTNKEMVKQIKLFLTSNPQYADHFRNMTIVKRNIQASEYISSCESSVSKKTESSDGLNPQNISTNEYHLRCSTFSNQWFSDEGLQLIENNEYKKIYDKQLNKLIESIPDMSELDSLKTFFAIAIKNLKSKASKPSTETYEYEKNNNQINQAIQDLKVSIYCLKEINRITGKIIDYKLIRKILSQPNFFEKNPEESVLRAFRQQGLRQPGFTAIDFAQDLIFNYLSVIKDSFDVIDSSTKKELFGE